MSEKGRAVLALVIAALLWSTGGVLIKWVDWHPMALSGARSLIAALTLWAIAGRLRFDWSLPQVGGAITYTVTVSLYIAACKLTTAANAILLEYTAPIWVALFGAWFLKERPSWLDGISIAISLGGLLLFFREGLSSRSLVGNLLAVLSGVTLAWMMLFLRKQRSGGPLESVVLGNILAAVVGLPYMLRGPWPDLRGWLVLLILGAAQLGLSYVLYTYAIQRVRALEAILILMLEPILNPIWVLLVIGERPTGWALAGGMLVVGSATLRGVLLALRPQRRLPGERSAAEQVEPSPAS
jgi:drug/metabolite transporter (DMT)-like permease